ncbi:MAG: DUF2961 domain-containing protein [Phycisphaerae bacterium]|nr:DUF2961 domain-containing protein [Phycisphaerae bacterium]
MKSIQIYLLAVLCVIFGLRCPYASAALSASEQPLIPGIEQLGRLDRLAEFHRSTFVGSVSSYDRTGGNDDGFGGKYSFVRKEGDALVLADLQGPGVIYRIWTPTPTDDWMEFYFDGEAAPRVTVRFRELFLGVHSAFPRPLVGYGAGGFYSYVPLPYKKSCKVLIRAPRVQFYQINYATYPETTEVASFSVERSEGGRASLEKAKRLFAASGSDVSDYVTPPGSTVKRFNKRIELASGQTTTVFQTDQPGRIVGLRMSPPQALAGKARDLVLRAYWDEDEKPAIEVPAGDFFGYAWGSPAMTSLLIGTNDQHNYCYWPMPFDQGARIELALERDQGTLLALEMEVLFVPVPRKADEGKFYALWRRENPTTKGTPFTFVETLGRGHLVGCIQQSQGMESGSTLFFEGDDQTTIDGQLVIHGTGSEDFYNGGWYDVPGRWETSRSFPLSGCLAYQKHLTRTGGYRFMLGDAYAYRESILQTIEHAPTGNEQINDYCGTTFLYSEKRPTCDMTLPSVAKRRVVDLKRIVFAAWWNVPISAFSFNNATLTKDVVKLNGQDVRFLSMRSQGGDWFGHHFISFNCELPAAGLYRISLDVVKGPAAGMVQLFQDEAPVGPAVDMYAAKSDQVQASLGTLVLPEGKNNLLFKITGKNEKSSGLGLDLVNIICERID